ncbi:MAG TPA: hypothetical protein VFO16_00300 [Pseudonocardiaceae bacterium]|nr:hypothetical protein [Pseudonocardiaceae bacterium]
MAVPPPPIPLPDPPMPPTRRAPVTMRAAVIGAVGALVAVGVATTAVMTGLRAVEILFSTGTAFTGTVTFLNKIAE